MGPALEDTFLKKNVWKLMKTDLQQQINQQDDTEVSRLKSRFLNCYHAQEKGRLCSSF